MSENALEGDSLIDSARCPTHMSMVEAIAGMRSLMKWLLLVFCGIMALTGYNIRETQQVKLAVVAGLNLNTGNITRLDSACADLGHRLRDLEIAQARRDKWSSDRESLITE